MLRKCPHHDIPKQMQLYIFYHGLKSSTRNVIDAAAGGSVMGKTTEEALQLLNEIFENAIQWLSERVIIKKAAMFMTRSSTKELANYDPGIERYLRSRRKEQTSSSQGAACKKMKNRQAEDINPLEILPPVHVEEQFDEVAPRPANRILRDYVRLDRFNYESSVRKPPMAVNNFEIRTGLIQTIKQSCIFTGDTSEDPHSHLIDFLELTETAKYNGVPPKAIKLRLFPFSLKGDVKTWLRSLPLGSITTWDQMTRKFLNKYFSPATTTKLRHDISNFLQTDTESVYQAWERLKAMLRKCPHHDIPKQMQLYIFYHGLKASTRNVIDAAAGGSVMGKTTEEALQLLNEIFENAIQWLSERVIIKKAAMFTTRSSTKELANYDPGIERYLRSRRKEQTSSSQGAACKKMKNRQAEDINPLEILPPVHVEEQFDEVAPRPANRILRDYVRLDRFNYESSVRKPPMAVNNFEIRTGLIQTIKQSCIFTGDTSEDPHSHLIDFLELTETAKYNGVPPKAIKLRLFPFSLKGDVKTWLRSLPLGSITTWDQMTRKFLNKYFSLATTTKLRQDISNFLQTDTESVYQAWERLKAMLRKCPHHDIPKQMQLYIFYHGLKSSTRNVIDAAAGGSVMGKTTEEALQLLNEIFENAIQWLSERVIIKKAAMEFSSITSPLTKLTKKGSSFVWSDEYEESFQKIKTTLITALVKLDLGEMKDIGVSLQFANQSTKKPKGIIENVLVKVDKFVFPVDFIVLEMKECPDEPIILGRPFLATEKAIIDVHQGQLILRVDEERVIFYMQKILRFSGDEVSSS
ncbi:uncharacterized protein LOC142177482 [Nicotiana tabacum]|uniref:Uncharacterized protein LOC142177482 n=1 Tax=Nicotiana tabacum TaxID=4097 RepID=A0AC58TZ18_TOBAC